MNWLATRGKIDEGRLTSKGYGMDSPIDDNATEAGRQANRRVEFKIRDVKKKSTESGDAERAAE